MLRHSIGRIETEPLLVISLSGHVVSRLNPPLNSLETGHIGAFFVFYFFPILPFQTHFSNDIVSYTRALLFFFSLFDTVFRIVDF